LQFVAGPPWSNRLLSQMQPDTAGDLPMDSVQTATQVPPPNPVAPTFLQSPAAHQARQAFARWSHTAYPALARSGYGSPPGHRRDCTAIAENSTFSPCSITHHVGDGSGVARQPFYWSLCKGERECNRIRIHHTCRTCMYRMEIMIHVNSS